MKLRLPAILTTVTALVAVGAGAVLSPAAADVTPGAASAARRFTTAGTPTHGATSAAGAPTIRAGQWTDTLGPDQSQRVYVIAKAAGSTLHATVAARPNIPLDAGSTYDGFTTHLTTADGAECGGEHQGYTGILEVLTATVRQRSRENAPACDAASSLVLTVTRGSESSAGSAPKSGSTPITLAVLEEPAVTNFDALAARVENAAQVRQAAPEAGDGGAAVTGGGSFSTAATLSPGSYTDTLHGGEAVFYRIKAEEGQAPALTAMLGASGDTGYARVAIRAFAPDWAHVNVRENSDSAIGKDVTYQFSTAAVLRSALPPVRYRNRESTDTDVSPVSVDGFYYFEVVAEKGGREWQAPLKLSAALSGTRETAPAYAAALVTDPGATATAGKQHAAPAGHSAVLLAAGAVLLFLGGFFLVMLLTRRRQSAPGVPVGASQR